MGRLDKQLFEINIAPIPKMLKDSARSSAEHCYNLGKLDAADEIFAELDKLNAGIIDGYDEIKKKFKEGK